MSASSVLRSSRSFKPKLNFFGVLLALASSWRRPVAPASAAFAPRLGVGPLPDGMDCLPHGAAVALVARDRHSAQRWYPALLADAVSASRVFLLAPSAEWADWLLSHAVLHTAHAQGRLVIWTMAPNLPSLLRTQGLQPLCAELQSVGLRPEHAVYVMDAQPLFMGMDVQPLLRMGEQLRVWCLKRQQPVVLGFFPPTEVQVDADASGTAVAAQIDVLPMLYGLCGMTMHIATLSASADHSTLQFERWNGNSGAVFQTGFGLKIDPSTQQLRYAGSRTQGQGQVLIEAPDQRAVIATRAAVAQQHGVPPHWHIVETLEDVAVATAHSVGATVLIDAGSSNEFEACARLVHHLRLTRPLSLKIVVRESTGKLRSHSEQALLQMGANAIFYRELGFSRLLQLLQDIHTQSYKRPINPDYAQALNAFVPALARGYQQASEFSRLVRDMLARTQDIGLGHSMVRLDIAPQIAHITALRACKMTRDGDLVTASRSAVYVFLFACREPDIESALQRLFEVPVAHLFSAQSADCSNAGMISMLDGLDKAARQGLSDYSSLLAPGAPATPVVPVALAASPTSSPAAVVPVLPQATLTVDTEVLVAPAALPAKQASIYAKPIGQRPKDHATP